ncbi:MAG TPA: hypothetical protein VFB62_26265 [Polyangiaceae bacterium]|jgi:hypothetical protein|nr:hypothetical protein [Polyangiaceae bacterium]
MSDPFAPHPGTIVLVDRATGEEKERPADEFPEAQRYVYLRNGEETLVPEEATERVPIVRIETATMDDRGNLVPREQATRMHVMELGPDGRRLRLNIRARKPRS